MILMSQNRMFITEFITGCLSQNQKQGFNNQIVSLKQIHEACSKCLDIHTCVALPEPHGANVIRCTSYCYSYNNSYCLHSSPETHLGLLLIIQMQTTSRTFIKNKK